MKNLFFLALVTLALIVGGCAAHSSQFVNSPENTAVKKTVMVTPVVMPDNISTPQKSASTAQIVLTGDKRRTFVLFKVIEAYWGKQDLQVLEGTGHQVLVTGHGGTQNVPISDKLLVVLEGAVGNPQSGDSLMALCPEQAMLLRQAMGPIGSQVAVAPVQVQQRASCPNCWPKAPSGKYDTLSMWEGVFVSLNTDNGRYPENVISAKVEYHGGKWQPRLVVRNTKHPKDILAIWGSRLANYARRVSVLKDGQPGQEGDSCYELAIIENGQVWKDETPDTTEW